MSCSPELQANCNLTSGPLHDCTLNKMLFSIVGLIKFFFLLSGLSFEVLLSLQCRAVCFISDAFVSREEIYGKGKILWEVGLKVVLLIQKSLLNLR